ncbi:MAG: DUF5678 domain-containing protein [Pyrinomonadaceae bacterium]
MSTKTLKQLNKYLNQWVALSEPGEEIVGAGKNVIEAEKDAKQKGYKGEITFFKVFPFDQYIPAA